VTREWKVSVQSYEQPRVAFLRIHRTPETRSHQQSHEAVAHSAEKTVPLRLLLDCYQPEFAGAYKGGPKYWPDRTARTIKTSTTKRNNHRGCWSFGGEHTIDRVTSASGERIGRGDGIAGPGRALRLLEGWSGGVGVLLRAAVESRGRWTGKQRVGLNFASFKGPRLKSRFRATGHRIAWGMLLL
jgi:hypothetical protein